MSQIRKQSKWIKIIEDFNRIVSRPDYEFLRIFEFDEINMFDPNTRDHITIEITGIDFNRQMISYCHKTAGWGSFMHTKKLYSIQQCEAGQYDDDYNFIAEIYLPGRDYGFKKLYDDLLIHFEKRQRALQIVTMRKELATIAGNSRFWNEYVYSEVLANMPAFRF